MELNLSTFVLEVINFLVLVWLLKRFFYQPVLTVIARRKEAIDKSLSEAATLHGEAEALNEQYKNRLAVWEEEQKAARKTMHQEISAERRRMMDQLTTSLAQERKKARVVDERRLMDALRKNEAIALAQSARFASLLLKRLAGAELEQRLFDLLMEELSNLPIQRLDLARTVWGETEAPIMIVSAYPLGEGQRSLLETTLDQLIKGTARYDYKRDAALIAGFRITIGPWAFHANLQDELISFAEAPRSS